jgi:hypothetical protein
MTSVTGAKHGEQEGRNESDRLHRLDQQDDLLVHFRPVEQLFLVMGKVDPNAVGGGELVLSCSEIGLNLAAQFRMELERIFGREGGGDTGTGRLG